MSMPVRMFYFPLHVTDFVEMLYIRLTLKTVNQINFLPYHFTLIDTLHEKCWILRFF